MASIPCRPSWRSASLQAPIEVCDLCGLNQEYVVHSLFTCRKLGCLSKRRDPCCRGHVGSILGDGIDPG